MKKYVFVLGRDPALSLAEIYCYLNARKIEFKLTEKEENTILIESNELNPKKLMHDLGGTIKIVSVLFQEKKFREIKEKIKEKELLEWMNEKFNFSLNFYGKEFQEKNEAENFFKSRFKKLKKKAFYRKPKKHKIKGFNSSPSQVHSWNLIEEESDFVFFKSKELFFGKTIECFNPKKLRERDIKRPEQKNLHSISLRLARILINLSEIKENQILLDPFCGIGTVLQEGLYNGLNVIGIELDDKTAGMARKNLTWFQKKYKTKNNWLIIQGDSSFVKETLKGKKFDGIATEPFLGPFLKKKPKEKEAKKIIEELGKLYFAFFKKLALIVKKQKIAIVLPEIESSNGKKFPLTEKVFSQHFNSVNPIKKIEGKAFPYNYMEKQSIITRKIYLLERKPN